MQNSLHHLITLIGVSLLLSLVMFSNVLFKLKKQEVSTKSKTIYIKQKRIQTVCIGIYYIVIGIHSEKVLYNQNESMITLFIIPFCFLLVSEYMINKRLH